MIEWGLPFVLFLLLLALIVRRLKAFIVKRLNKQSRAARPAHWKLLKDKPGDWKDAVYNPKGFRNKK
ncbi:MAG: hypothetical protein U0938_10760 [Thiobacillus sp.]|nr:hypothetical protein [Thiobacillus sp.]